VASETSLIGDLAGSGTVHVTGAAQWQTGDLTVGADGTGTLEIAGGGQVTSGNGFLGYSENSTGLVTWPTRTRRERCGGFIRPEPPSRLPGTGAGLGRRYGEMTVW
jgi:T5SS/PEP-CTERM-associated repeat protein